MIIDWSKFAPALFLLLLPIGLFHGKKVRFRPIARDWNEHWSQILTLGLHWIDLGRAALGGWLLFEALSLPPGSKGMLVYYLPLTQGLVSIVAVGLQTLVCKEEESGNAPFMFVSGLLLGLYPPAVAAFPILIALTAACGTRTPLAYFPLLALSTVAVGFAFDRKSTTRLILSFCAILLPWLYSLMFSRDLVITYRAKRTAKDLKSSSAT